MDKSYTFPAVNLNDQLNTGNRFSTWQVYQRNVDLRSGSLTVRDNDGNTLYAGLLPSGDLGFQIVDEEGNTVFDPFATDVSAVALKVGTGDSTPTLNAVLQGTGVGSSAWTTNLSGLTFSSPTISNFSNATHDHTNATGGGQLHIVNATTNTLTVARGGTGATSASAARTNLGVVIGTDVQAHSAVLDATTASFTTDDETKLDGMESGADVTDTANVTAAGALMDSEVDADIKTLSLPANTTISTFGASLIDDAASSNARTTLGLVIGTDVQAYSAVLAATTASFTTTLKDKLDGIEALADVTDTTNVAGAGALMDSEVTNLADVKAFDPTDYATAAQGSAADSALQDVVDDATPQLGGNLDIQSFNIEGADADDFTKLAAITSSAAELNHVGGVTSAIQTQLNAKAATSHTHTESDITDLSHDAVSIQGVDVDDTDIGNGKILQYNSTSGNLEYESLAGGGDMTTSTYDPATIAEQLVGLTATQTLTNKTIDGDDNTISNLSAAWPVDSIFISVSSTNPATSLGFGTWVAFGEGKVLIGLDSGDTDFDTVEETGGAKTHEHGLSDAWAYIGLNSSTDRFSLNKTISSWTPTYEHTGGSNSVAGSRTNATQLGGDTDSGSSLPPYIVVYMWKRTA
jgi:hypothetical protein